MAGFEPKTFRFERDNTNHCATESYFLFLITQTVLKNGSCWRLYRRMLHARLPYDIPYSFFGPGFHVYTCMRAFPRLIALQHTEHLHDVTTEHCAPCYQRQKNFAYFIHVPAQNEHGLSKGRELYRKPPFREIFCLTFYLPEVAYPQSTNRELSNDLRFVQLRWRMVVPPILFFPR